MTSIALQIARRLPLTPIRHAARAGQQLSHRALNATVQSRHRSAALLRQFNSIHTGQTGVIIGNGPSLAHTDMDALRYVPTFGLNRFYLMYDRTELRATYHVVVNSLVVSQAAQQLQEVRVPLFTTRRNAALLAGAPQLRVLDRLTGPYFASDPLSGIWEGATVTTVALQLAYYMGFRKIILVGVDHSFSTSGPAHKVVTAGSEDNDHFDKRYFANGFKWQLPDLDTSEIGYALAREAFDARGREIVDCTVGGKLEVFRKGDLATELSRG